MFDLTDVMHTAEYTKLLVGLIAMMDPVGAVPVFLALAARMSPVEQRLMAVIGVSASAAILFVFAFFGDAVLEIFGITVPAFRVTGGIVLLVMALDMIRSEFSPETDNGLQGSLVSAAVVPLALPLLAGPGTITTVIVYSQMHVSVQHEITVAVVIVVAHLIMLACLLAAPRINRMIGDTGIDVFNRLMGLIVAAIAFEFILDGIALHYPGLFQYEGH